jgi:RimJ/RimL family protein N-acetyltransferase
VILFDHPEHVQRLAEASTARFDPSDVRCIARVGPDRELLGGMLVTDFTGASVALHVAGFTPTWLSRDLLWTVFHYVFVQLGCVKAFTQVEEANQKSILFCERLGFLVECRVRDVFPTGDLIVFGMYRNQCRWLDWQPRSIGYLGK